MTPDEEWLAEMLARELHVPLDDVVPTANLREDLGANSLDMMEVALFAEDHFGCQFDDDDINALETVAEFFAMVNKGLKAHG